jgi:hypothetical protein
LYLYYNHFVITLKCTSASTTDVHIRIIDRRDAGCCLPAAVTIHLRRQTDGRTVNNSTHNISTLPCSTIYIAANGFMGFDSKRNRYIFTGNKSFHFLIANRSPERVVFSSYLYMNGIPQIIAHSALRIIHSCSSFGLKTIICLRVVYSFFEMYLFFNSTQLD